MTTTTAQPETRALTFRVPVDALSKYAGITALVSAALALAGILATVAYLSAWNVPAPIVRLDPATAALRAETVVYQFALLGVVLYGLSALHARLRGRRRIVPAVFVGLAVALGGVEAMLVTSNALGPAASIAGAAVLYAAHLRRWLDTRGIALLFTIITLVAAWVTGAESGALIRDEAAYRTPVVVTAKVAIAGLDGGVEDGGAWRYEGLYLVFRDSESVYLSRPGAGSTVWVLPTGTLMALGISGR